MLQGRAGYDGYVIGMTRGRAELSSVAWSHWAHHDHCSYTSDERYGDFPSRTQSGVSETGDQGTWHLNMLTSNLELVINREMSPIHFGIRGLSSPTKA